jgi:MSHA biogenesis protein MshG
MFDHLEFEKEMSQRVKSATRYPSFVMMAIGGAIVVINIFVIPSFAGVYKGFHAELPVVTRFLIGFSDFTLNYWPELLVAGAAAVFAFRAWVRTVSGRLIWDRAVLAFPVIGPLLRKAVLARFSRSLALALHSGLPVTEALEAAMQTTDNQHVRQRLDLMRSAIDRGESITSAARRTEVFTPVVLQMISVGEESGTIDELLHEVALAYEGDVAYELKTLSDTIEPLLIVVLGVLVLILALGVFLPMWDLGHAALGGPAH